MASIKAIEFLPKGGRLKSDPFLMHFVLPLAPHLFGRAFGEISLLQECSSLCGQWH